MASGYSQRLLTSVVPQAFAWRGPFEIPDRVGHFPSIGVLSFLPSQTLASPRRTPTASPARASPNPSPFSRRRSLPPWPGGTSAARRRPARARRLPSASRSLSAPCNRGRAGRGRWCSCRHRELATQVHDVIGDLLGHDSKRVVSIFGGTGYRDQVRALHKGVNIVVACPGRLEDLIERGDVRLDDVTTVVLDEADRMADMGFLPAVRRLMDQTVGEPPGAPVLGHHRPRGGVDHPQLPARPGQGCHRGDRRGEGRRRPSLLEGGSGGTGGDHCQIDRAARAGVRVLPHQARGGPRCSAAPGARRASGPHARRSDAGST